jgi:hypothetical protein
MSTFSEQAPLGVAVPGHEGALSAEALLPDGSPGTLVRASRQWSKRYLQVKAGFVRAPPPPAAPAPSSPSKADGVRFVGQGPRSPTGAGARAGEGAGDGAAQGQYDDDDDREYTVLAVCGGGGHGCCCCRCC